MRCATVYGTCCTANEFMEFLKHLWVLLCIGFAIAFSGCAARSAHDQARPLIDRGYVDLQPGWRIRVVTPILKSGKFMVQTMEAQASGNSIALTTGSDFIGYEIAYYKVDPRESGGVAVSFDSAEFRTDGKATKQPRPKVALFDLPESSRYVRLIFLTRVSVADRNQAIVAASNLADLDALTQRVQTNPDSSCKIDQHSSCSWVPEGIAVQPERRKTGFSGKWVPAT